MTFSLPFQMAFKSKPSQKLTLVDVQMLGAASRLYMSGTTADVEKGPAESERALATIEGRKG
jgi:hypothetical protein